MENNEIIGIYIFCGILITFIVLLLIFITRVIVVYKKNDVEKMRKYFHIMFRFGTAYNASEEILKRIFFPILLVGSILIIIAMVWMLQMFYSNSPV
jgi:uncharacterized membrane protein